MSNLARRVRMQTPTRVPRASQALDHRRTIPRLLGEESCVPKVACRRSDLVAHRGRMIAMGKRRIIRCVQQCTCLVLNSMKLRAFAGECTVYRRRNDLLASSLRPDLAHIMMQKKENGRASRDRTHMRSPRRLAVKSTRDTNHSPPYHLGLDKERTHNRYVFAKGEHLHVN